jgi:hypothetical protein
MIITDNREGSSPVIKRVRDIPAGTIFSASVSSVGGITRFYYMLHRYSFVRLYDDTLLSLGPDHEFYDYEERSGKLVLDKLSE